MISVKKLIAATLILSILSAPAAMCVAKEQEDAAFAQTAQDYKFLSIFPAEVAAKVTVGIKKYFKFVKGFSKTVKRYNEASALGNTADMEKNKADIEFSINEIHTVIEDLIATVSEYQAKLRETKLSGEDVSSKFVLLDTCISEFIDHLCDTANTIIKFRRSFASENPEEMSTGKLLLSTLMHFKQTVKNVRVLIKRLNVAF